jgi:hypothetical protein
MTGDQLFQTWAERTTRAAQKTVCRLTVSRRVRQFGRHSGPPAGCSPESVGATVVDQPTVAKCTRKNLLIVHRNRFVLEYFVAIRHRAPELQIDNPQWPWRIGLTLLFQAVTKWADLPVLLRYDVHLETPLSRTSDLH